MNIFEAVQWLVQNKGKELEGSHDSCDSRFSVRFSGERLEFYCTTTWLEWTPDYAKASAYTFATIPRFRVLPLLPPGDRWWDNEKRTALTIVTSDFTRMSAIDNVEQLRYCRDQELRYAALAEEFETRPK